MPTFLSVFASAPGSTADPLGVQRVVGPEEGADVIELAVGFDGVGAEGIDMIWAGRVIGGAGGEVTVRVTYAGDEADRALPLWPVRATVFVASDDPTRSFAADMSGRMDWRTGDVELSGAITEGWRRDARISQTLRIDRGTFDGTGRLRLADTAATE